MEKSFGKEQCIYLCLARIPQNRLDWYRLFVKSSNEKISAKRKASDLITLDASFTQNATVSELRISSKRESNMGSFW